MNKWIFTLFLVSILKCILIGQETIEIFFDNTGKSYINISVEEGNTLYSLSKRYNIPVREIIEANEFTNDRLGIGQLVKIPIQSQRNFHEYSLGSNFIPLKYEVKKGDNMFRIAHHSGMQTIDLVTLNQKSDVHLDIGEQLIVGWLKSDFDLVSQRSLFPELALLPNIYQDEDFHKAIASTLSSQPTFPEFDFVLPPQIRKERGIAFWDKSEEKSSELMVMHPKARINSKIFIYNPMLNRKVEAHVVSEFPQEAYPDDISVVISPSVADALGALDKRILVEITYVE